MAPAASLAAGYFRFSIFAALHPFPFPPPRDPSLSGRLSTLEHPGRHRHVPSQEARARYPGEDSGAILGGADRPSPTGRPTNPSPSAYGEWPGRINRKAGISFRRCGSAVPRLRRDRPQPASQIIVRVMGHAHRMEPTGNNKVEGGLSGPIHGD
ncbi:hypothetical protein X777_05962 [Ooceraea biroi]|uniref:Uncharacterized protein n=1 Tax=Ooceraea biroi TaxID=2015173 RepID=A0A026WDJ5_OOCBI|nr:hypothetical protein X777_05962 [Ooceraea biroi]